VKLSSLYFSITITSFFALNSLTASAIDLNSLAKSALPKASSQGMPFKTDSMIKFAADKLGLPHATVESSFGSLLKVAKDNLAPENFDLIAKAIPDTKNYLAKAPKVAKSSMSSLLSKAGETGKKAESLHYIDSAFRALGVSKKQVPSLVNSFSSYLNKSGYQEAASSLKKGLNFL
jgi:hypothetical protein